MVSRLFSSIPSVTRKLLIANVAVFLLQSIAGASEATRAWPLWFELWPWVPAPYEVDGPGFMPWQLITSGFMHGNLFQLLINMLVLVMFGASLEHEWGARRYAIYYFACLLGAALLQLVVVSIALYDGRLYVMLGASGAVYGLMLAYGLIFPHRKVTLLPLPIVLKARTLVILYIGATLAYGVLSTDLGVAYFSHLGGMIVGWFVIRYWRSHPPRGGSGGPRRDPRAEALRARRKASKLRAVK
ncbi:rhomboid family intramembrane serine protease [Lysobacter enzymogenes]|uniref:rhomboid family intramembrane serine protease n=1 Tax=Lysobacter enzymogenes TaxID=69 RepID=UPI0037481CBD